MLKRVYICDSCESEITEVEAKSTHLIVNVQRAGTFNLEINVQPTGYREPEQFHICKYCIVDLIVRELDNRPKPQREY
jgi:hypothetical protein